MDIGFVVKVSKLCNLRCTYCYEMPELANKERMSTEEIGRMFRHIRSFLRKRGKGTGKHLVEFVWHGGEPFAQPVSYWEEIMDLETKVFGSRSQRNSVFNSVQSNLTLLGDKHLSLLRRYFHVGFSYDVVNDLRIDAGGRSTGPRVQEKVEWLLSNNIPLAGLAVISKANIRQPKAVADFFLERNLSFRASYIYHAQDTLAGAREAAVPFEDYLHFLEQLSLLPEVQKAVEEGLVIYPITMVLNILRWQEQGAFSSFTDEDFIAKELLLGINTNGDVYSQGDMYTPAFKHGNIFSQSFEEFLSSEGRFRRMERTKIRLERVCEACPFFRMGCDGSFVSHATPEEYRDFERVGSCHYGWMARWIKQNKQRGVCNPEHRSRD